MKFVLTKETFIKKSMNGDVFRYAGDKYFYDDTKIPPFRVNEDALRGYWNNFNGKNLFTLEKWNIERRWKWQRNTSEYISDKYAEEKGYSHEGWYKLEDDYTDVETRE